MAAVVQVRALTPEENERITRLAQARTAAARLVERARIIALASQGQRVPAIARELGVGERMVRLWIRRFNGAGMDGLDDAPRPGRPATYTPSQVGEVIAAALTDPRTLGLPCGYWTLDRREAYLNEDRALPITRSRIDELLSAEGLRWRTQETWFGERAALVPPADGDSRPPTPIKTKEREVDPAFAQRRGPSRPAIWLLPPAV